MLRRVGTTIRPATPRDGAFLAWVCLAAGRSHVATSFWDLLLATQDGDLHAYLERLLLAPQRSWWHHAHFLIAEVDGEPAAALSGFAPEDPGVAQPEKAVLEAARDHGLDEASLAAGMTRAAPFFSCTTSPSPGAWLVENVATLPAFRRRGLVAELVPGILDRGRAAGHGLAQLTIFIGNSAAQRVYERAGFELVSEKRHPDFEKAIGCPGLARMERQL
jgi:ribosomal protein S18 acetylase RimI-like enzyme